MSSHELAESIHAKNYAMTDFVEMVCKQCSDPVDYFIQDGCPNCGRITIECVACGYRFEFGE